MFIGAATVWKLKKAVHLAFLDFTTLPARHRFLLRELAVNRAAAPGLYRDVVPVIRQPDGTLALGEPDHADAEVVDWVLRMAPVPPADFLDVIADRGDLTPELLDAVADTVAAYHNGLPPIRGDDPAAAMAHVARGNARAAHDAGLPNDRVHEWLAAASACLDADRAMAGDRGRQTGMSVAPMAIFIWAISASGTADRSRSTRSNSTRPWRRSTWATTSRSC